MNYLYRFTKKENLTLYNNTYKINIDGYNYTYQLADFKLECNKKNDNNVDEYLVFNVETEYNIAGFLIYNEKHEEKIKFLNETSKEEYYNHYNHMYGRFGGNDIDNIRYLFVTSLNGHFKDYVDIINSEINIGNTKFMYIDCPVSGKGADVRFLNEPRFGEATTFDRKKASCDNDEYPKKGCSPAIPLAMKLGNLMSSPNTIELNLIGTAGITYIRGFVLISINGITRNNNRITYFQKGNKFLKNFSLINTNIEDIPTAGKSDILIVNEITQQIQEKAKAQKEEEEQKKRDKEKKEREKAAKAEKAEKDEKAQKFIDAFLAKKAEKAEEDSLAKKTKKAEEDSFLAKRQKPTTTKFI